MKKRFLSLTLIFCMCFSFSGYAFASETPAAVNELLPAKSTKSLAKMNNFISSNLSVTPYNYELSEEKTKVKTAYLETSGDKLGPVTIVYKTMIMGGRPQFAYDTVKIGWDFTNSNTYYAIGNPSIDYSNDLIRVIFPAQMGLLYDRAIVSFTP